MNENILKNAEKTFNTITGLKNRLTLKKNKNNQGNDNARLGAEINLLLSSFSDFGEQEGFKMNSYIDLLEKNKKDSDIFNFIELLKKESIELIDTKNFKDMKYHESLEYIFMIKMPFLNEEEDAIEMQTFSERVESFKEKGKSTKFSRLKWVLDEDTEGMSVLRSFFEKSWRKESLHNFSFFELVKDVYEGKESVYRTIKDSVELYYSDVSSFNSKEDYFMIRNKNNTLWTKDSSVSIKEASEYLYITRNGDILKNENGRAVLEPELQMASIARKAMLSNRSINFGKKPQKDRGRFQMG